MYIVGEESGGFLCRLLLGLALGNLFQKGIAIRVELLNSGEGLEEPVLDVAVDIRKGSPTYGQHVTCLLAAHDEEGERFAKELGEEVTSSISPLPSYIGLQFFVPRGFAHGFAVLSETAVFQYKCDEFYHPEADGGISIVDNSLGIDWKIPTDKALLSEKDTKHSPLKDFDSPFDINVPLY